MQQSQAPHTLTEGQALIADMAQIEWAKVEATALAAPKKNEHKVVLPEVVQGFKTSALNIGEHEFLHLKLLSTTDGSWKGLVDASHILYHKWHVPSHIGQATGQYASCILWLPLSLDS
jgi:hypothetical protein